MTKWINEIGWDTTTGQIRNEQHDGYIEGRSTYLIAASRQIVNRLPKDFNESMNEGYNYLEQILDLGDGIINDCFSYFTAIDEDSKPSGSGASIKATLSVQHDSQTQDIDIFDITRVGPALTSQKHSFGDHAFAIEATDGITTQKARPIRKHELLKAYGIESKQGTKIIGTDTEWRDTLSRLRETAPVQEWEPLLASLYAAEVDEATAETTRLYADELNEESSADPKHHFTDSKVLFAFNDM